MCSSDLDDIRWMGADKQTRVLGIDAAYSGVGGDRCVMTDLIYGPDSEGNVRIAFAEQPVIIPVTAAKAQQAEEQIAEFVRLYAQQRGIPAENVGFDSTGRGTLMSAFARLWSRRDGRLAVRRGASLRRRPPVTPRTSAAIDAGRGGLPRPPGCFHRRLRYATRPYNPSTNRSPASTCASLSAGKAPSRSTKAARSSVLTCETWTTLRCGRPAHPDGSSTLPGAPASTALLLSAATTTVAMRLALKSSLCSTSAGRRIAGAEPRGTPKSTHQT